MINQALREEICSQLLETHHKDFEARLECIPSDILDDLLKDENFKRNYAIKKHEEENIRPISLTIIK